MWLEVPKGSTTSAIQQSVTVTVSRLNRRCRTRVFYAIHPESMETAALVRVELDPEVRP